MAAAGPDLEVMIRIIAQDVASQVFQQVGTQLKTLGAQAEATSAQVKDLGDTVDANAAKIVASQQKASGGFGSMMSSYRDIRLGAIAFGAAAQIAFSEIESGTSKATQGHKELQIAIEASRAAMIGLMFVMSGMNPVLGAIAAAAILMGSVVGTVFSEQQNQADEAKKHIEELVQPFNDVEEAVNKLQKAQPFAGIAETIGVSQAEIENALKQTTTDAQAAADAVEKLNNNMRAQSVDTSRIEVLKGQIAQLQEWIKTQGDANSPDSGFSRQLKADEAELKVYEDALAGAQGAEGGLAQGAQNAIDKVNLEAAALKTAEEAAKATKNLPDAAGAYQAVVATIQQGGAAMREGGATAESLANAIKDVGEAAKADMAPIDNLWKKLGEADTGPQIAATSFDALQKSIEQIKQKAAQELQDPNILGDPAQKIVMRFDLDLQIAKSSESLVQQIADTALQSIGESKTGAIKPVKVTIPVDPQAVWDDNAQKKLMEEADKAAQAADDAQITSRKEGRKGHKVKVYFGVDAKISKEELAKSLQDAVDQMGPMETDQGKVFAQLDLIAKTGQLGSQGVLPRGVFDQLSEAADQSEKSLKAVAKAYEDTMGTFGKAKTVEMPANIFDAVNKAIDNEIKHFKDLKEAEQDAAGVLASMASSDPEKFKQFLEAKNIAPTPENVEAAKKAFSDIAQGIDPAKDAAGQYKDIIDQLNSDKIVQTEAQWQDQKARADIDSFKGFLNAFIAEYGGVNINVSASLSGGNLPSGYTPPPPSDGSSPVNPPAGGGRAGGGPVQGGVPYVVGEQGAELFIPTEAGQILNQKQLDAWIKTHSSELDALYKADPSFFDKLLKEHKDWSELEWFRYFILYFNQQKYFGGNDSMPNITKSRLDSSKGFAGGFLGMVGPSYGGPVNAMIGEGGENEFVAIIPQSQLSGGGSYGSTSPGPSPYGHESSQVSGRRGGHRIIDSGTSGRGGGGSTTHNGHGNVTVDVADAMDVKSVKVLNIYIANQSATHVHGANNVSSGMVINYFNQGQ